MESAVDWCIFVSYSHVDSRIVIPITDLIRVTGHRVFRDTDSIPAGKKWRLIIAESLTSCRTLLLFWSRTASDSKSVAEEYMMAIALGKDIVPVLLDDSPLPAALAEYQWIDFRLFVSDGVSRSLTALTGRMTGSVAMLVSGSNTYDALLLASTLKQIEAEGGLRPTFSSEQEISIVGALSSRIFDNPGH